VYKSIRHIYAKSDEWIQVHRNKGRSARRSLGWAGIIILIIACWIAWECVKWLFGLFMVIVLYLAVAAATSAGVYIWFRLKRKPS
jgi:predicted membrane channel-forming protein YqfA (hemolysin III family)